MQYTIVKDLKWTLLNNDFFLSSTFFLSIMIGNLSFYISWKDACLILFLLQMLCDWSKLSYAYLFTFCYSIGMDLEQINIGVQANWSPNGFDQKLFLLSILSCIFFSNDEGNPQCALHLPLFNHLSGSLHIHYVELKTTTIFFVSFLPQYNCLIFLHILLMLS